jgi:hypothetical protein
MIEVNAPTVNSLRLGREIRIMTGEIRGRKSRCTGISEDTIRFQGQSRKMEGKRWDKRMKSEKPNLLRGRKRYFLRWIDSRRRGTVAARKNSRRP